MSPISFFVIPLSYPDTNTNMTLFFSVYLSFLLKQTEAKEAENEEREFREKKERNPEPQSSPLLQTRAAGPTDSAEISTDIKTSAIESSATSSAGGSALAFDFDGTASESLTANTSSLSLAVPGVPLSDPLLHEHEILEPELDENPPIVLAPFKKRTMAPFALRAELFSRVTFSN